MRLLRLASIAAIVLLGSFSLARASLVDASAAEAAYAKGDFAAARPLFDAALEQYRTANKNSQDYKAYREAAYLLDRLADCCFMQRDWKELKLNLDTLYVVAVSEFNLINQRIQGAPQSGVSRDDLRELNKLKKEAQRYSTLMQLKRSIGLALFDTNGEGAVSVAASKQYQELMSILRGVIGVKDGIYSIDTSKLDIRVDQITRIYDALHQLVDLDALWDRYPLATSHKSSTPPAKDDKTPGPADGAAPQAPPEGGK